MDGSLWGNSVQRQLAILSGYHIRLWNNYGEQLELVAITKQELL